MFSKQEKGTNCRKIYSKGKLQKFSPHFSEEKLLSSPHIIIILLLLLFWERNMKEHKVGCHY